MSLGRRSQTVESLKPPGEAMADAARALELIGTVTTNEPENGEVAGKVKFGLQTVTVAVSATPAKTGAMLELSAQSDDLAGLGARSAVSRLRDALSNLDNPDYVPDRKGISGKALLRNAVLFGAGFVLLAVLWKLAPWVPVLVAVVGGGAWFCANRAKKALGWESGQDLAEPEPYPEVSVPHFIAAESGRFRFLAGCWAGLACLVLVAAWSRLPWGLLPILPPMAWVWLRRRMWCEAEAVAGRGQVMFTGTGLVSRAARAVASEGQQTTTEKGEN